MNEDLPKRFCKLVKLRDDIKEQRKLQELKNLLSLRLAGLSKLIKSQPKTNSQLGNQWKRITNADNEALAKVTKKEQQKLKELSSQIKAISKRMKALFKDRRNRVH